MRTFALTLAAWGILAVAGLAQNGVPAEEVQKLEGTWLGVYVEMDGQQLSEDDARALALTLKDGQYVLKSGDRVEEQGTYLIDTTQTPHFLNATPNVGPNKGQTMQGIYEIDGDVHRTCFGSPGKARPTSFTAPAGSGQSLYVMRRQRP